MAIIFVLLLFVCVSTAVDEKCFKSDDFESQASDIINKPAYMRVQLRNACREENSTLNKKELSKCARKKLFSLSDYCEKNKILCEKNISYVLDFFKIHFITREQIVEGIKNKLVELLSDQSKKKQAREIFDSCPYSHSHEEMLQCFLSKLSCELCPDLQKRFNINRRDCE